MADQQSYGQRIRQVRKAQGLTQVELAKEAGMAVNSLRRYEADERPLSLPTLEKIAKALKVPLVDLMWQEANQLTQEEANELGQMQTDDDDAEYWEGYRRLDHYGRRAVQAIIRVENERLNEEEERQRRNGHGPQTRS